MQQFSEVFDSFPAGDKYVCKKQKQGDALSIHYCIIKYSWLQWKIFQQKELKEVLLLDSFLHSAGETLALLGFFDDECDLLTSNFLVALVTIVQYYMLRRQVWFTAALAILERKNIDLLVHNIKVKTVWN